MESSKWLAAVASIWIQCSSGASYAFGIYSPALKSTQGYDQSTLDTVSVFKDIGANAGILSGLLYTAVAATPSSGGGRISFLRGGPWVVHLAGAVQCFAGYFFMWLAVTGIINRPPVAVMSLFMFIAAHAQTFLNTANVVAAVQNFPDHSGTIVGIMKGFLGLSGAILIQVYQTIFNNNPSSLILMLALLPTIVTLMLMFFVTVHGTPSRNEEKHLDGFLLISLAIAAYLLFLRILENLFVFPQWVKIITFLILLALLSSPISVVVKAQRADLETQPPSITSSTSLLIDEPELESPTKLAVEDLIDYDDEMSRDTVQRRGSSILQPDEQKNLWQAMRSIDFWFLFFAMICGMGSGLATINNISQIGESLGYTTLARSTLVSFWSIWNFLGRLGAGYISDIFLLRRGWPRPLFMVFTLAAMTGGHVIIASGFPGNLYVGSLLVGRLGAGYISVFKDVGANFGILSGLLYSSVTAPRRIGGPWVVLLAGAIQCFAGYFLMWLTVVGILPKPPLLIMCLYMLLAAHAMTFFNTANVVTAVQNFPNYRGTAVGIMKGFLGLSGAILIQVYQTIFRNKPTAYLLLLALLPPITTILFMSFVTISQTNEDDEKKHLNGFSSIALVLASYLMAVIIVGNIFSLRMSVRIFTFGILIFLLLSPISVAISAHKEKSYRIIKYLLEQNSPEDEQSRSQAHFVDMGQRHDNYDELPAGADQETHMNERKTPEWGENMNLFQAMCTTGFWFLFITTACGMGTGLATVNNISQIGGSLGYSILETNTLVSLWSIWNFLGRFGAGYISDYFLRSLGWSRPLFIVVTLASMTVGLAVIASGLPGALYAGSIIVGICYGSQWSLMPTIASEIFGAAHFGTIFNTITVAGPVGSYILSVWVVGYLYDKVASDEGNMCAGTHCFMLSFFIMASSTFFGALVALALFFRTRNFYNNVVRRRGASTLTG